MILHRVSLLIPYNQEFEIILQRRKGFIKKKTDVDFGFFGGHLEEGESFDQALAREIKEELTINIKNIKNLRHFKDYKFIKKEKSISGELCVYICLMSDVSSMKVKEGIASTLKINDAIKTNIDEIDKRILTDLKEFIENEQSK